MQPCRVFNESCIPVYQVVAAVGFKAKRLEIPRDLDPRIGSLIESCWAK